MTPGGWGIFALAAGFFALYQRGERARRKRRRKAALEEWLKLKHRKQRK